MIEALERGVFASELAACPEVRMALRPRIRRMVFGGRAPAAVEVLHLVPAMELEDFRRLLPLQTRDRDRAVYLAVLHDRGDLLSTIWEPEDLIRLLTDLPPPMESCVAVMLGSVLATGSGGVVGGVLRPLQDHNVCRKIAWSALATGRKEAIEAARDLLQAAGGVPDMRGCWGTWRAKPLDWETLQTIDSWLGMGTVSRHAPDSQWWNTLCWTFLETKE